MKDDLCPICGRAMAVGGCEPCPHCASIEADDELWSCEDCYHYDDCGEQ